ncbi:MAG: asparagine synthase (glutamine-hydrolyzing) [bacterium]|nr:asparagine synthase (glutamine-hydrolyzing) [Candidatus Sumerlaeota bacterium]
MCGITGKVNRDPARPVDAELIARMKRCMAHRGPDDDGDYIVAPAGFGFQRLAIIDLSTGHQPMTNEDDSAVIIFNGEIYNFPELRDQLMALGHRFKTRSDTETILHGYEQWGTAVAERLRGMFAFAIFDHKTGALYMARDRAGKKPLYYARLRPGAPDESLVFASEMKSLLADPSVERRVDPAALNHYFSYQYVPHPWTIFEGVKKLPPAHWLTWRAGQLRVECYWRLEYEPKRRISEEQAIEETLEQVDEAVRIRLMSEVPLGCFLSGGIDSSAVVAMMRRHIAGDLKTFSIGFREEKFNELPYARRAAKQFETHHEEFIVEPRALECLGALAWHFDEPFADSSAIPTYYLSKMTRRYVTVALNGDGGDESFAGYTRYKGFPAFNRYGNIPRVLRRMADAPLAFAAEMFPRSAGAELLSYVNSISLECPEKLYVQSMIYFREYQKRRLFSPQYRTVLNEAEGDSEMLTMSLMNDGVARELIDKMMYSDIRLYLPGALLPKVDRMTMAVSLEGRSPFLDHKLMEFAARLPAGLKFRDSTLKYLLKKALLRFFPADFLDRPKTGFGAPIGEWFRGELLPLAQEYLIGGKARGRGYFDTDYVGRMLTQHLDGSQNHSNRLWALIMFEAWCRTFLDRPDPLAGPITV